MEIFLFGIDSGMYHVNVSLVLVVDVIAGLGNRFAILIIAAIIAWITRIVLLGFMNRWMMTKSKKAESVVEDNNQAEVESRKALVFKEYSSNTEMPNAQAHREEIVTRAKKSMSRQFRTDMLITLLYLLAGVILYKDLLLGEEVFSAINGDPTGNYYNNEMDFAIPYMLYVCFFGFWSIMRYIGHRHQFQAYRKGVFGLVAPLWKFVFAVFQSRWCLVWGFIVIIVAFPPIFFRLITGFFGEGLLALAPVVFHLFILRRLKKNGRKRPNVKLLILRVFLINKTSMFTFSRLAKFWKHFGSYFTVADPSFFRVHWKQRFNYKFPIFILFVFVIYTKLENLDSSPEAMSPFGPFVFLLLVGAFVYIIMSIRRMKRNFMSQESTLKKNLANLDKWPVRYDNTFKEMPVPSYDNTWKMTVDNLVDAAKVVLMDLRGFSEKNKGCEYEVNLILDRVPLDNILFLGYPDAMPLIKETILRQYSSLHMGSPNLHLEVPEATLYVIQKENNKEIQDIIDLLLDRGMHVTKA